MKNLFKCFYTTSVEIHQPINAGAYSSEMTSEPLCTIMADVQPYPTNSQQNIFGVFSDIRLVMYSDDNENIKVGNIAVTDGEKYIISFIKRRELGVTVYLKKA